MKAQTQIPPGEYEIAFAPGDREGTARALKFTRADGTELVIDLGKDIRADIAAWLMIALVEQERKHPGLLKR
jgi:hypothetical protein